MGTATQVITQFEARGAVAELFRCRDGKILLHGPAGTGKTRGALEKVHLALTKYPNARGLMVRKTRSSMTNSVIELYEKDVLVPADRIKFHTPSTSYPYPNLSSLVVGGLDDSQKVMSSRYDIIFIAEATETSRDDWDDLSTRLRNNKMPYQQIIGDCNPAPPSHWLWRDAQAGMITAFASKHEDNPFLYDAVKKDWTTEGKKYLTTVLDKLSGVRYKRLRLGLWCSSEGMVYENWDETVHVIPWFEIPKSWPRYWGFDWGYTNPFSWGAFAEDPDGRLYCYRQIYMTQKTVKQHCQTILSLNEPRPRALICDHDAEDRATAEQELRMQTIPAIKDVSSGIQAVTDRLRIAGDGKPRLFYLKGSLVDVDKELSGKKLPTCAEEEFDSYVWDEDTERKKEVPIKKLDHGLDMSRYVVKYIDQKIHFAPSIRALT